MGITMSEKKARFRIKKGEVEIEYEGSTNDVNNRYKEAFTWVKTVSLGPSRGSTKRRGKERAPKRERKKAPSVITPLPLDLKEKDGKPSLRALYKEKAPKNYMEKITVFAYYLKHHLNVNRMEAGHVVSCCKEVKIRVPRAIQQLFYDTHKTYGWLNIEDGREFAVITTAGENLVEYDLPREKQARNK